MELLFIRHGQAETVEYAESGADPALSPLGRRQADAMAAYVAARTIEKPIDAIVASPMKRASETAAPLAAALGLDVAYDDRLMEFDAGHASYKIVPQAEMSEKQVKDILGGMRNPEFVSRVRQGVDDVVSANRGRTVAVVCHGGVIMHAVAHLLGAPQIFLSLNVENTAISRLQVNGKSGFATLGSFGEAPWLEHLAS